MKLALLITLVAALIAFASGPAVADKTPDGVPMFTKPKKDPVVDEVDDAEAKALLEALDEAVEAKDVDEILAALKPFVTAQNEDFIKPLEKLTKNRSAEIRRDATEALGSQVPAKKVGPILFKVLMNRSNKKELDILGAAVRSIRRAKFDNQTVYKELKSHYRKVTSMEIMRECARYFGEMKKYGSFRMLIAWVEQPQPGNVNDPNNPPQAYWERMHAIWMEIKFTVLASLKAMTGQEFELEKDWREWARTPAARRLGLK